MRNAILFGLLFLLVVQLKGQKISEDIQIRTYGEYLNSKKMYLMVPVTLYDSLRIYINQQLWAERSISFEELSNARAGELLYLPVNPKAILKDSVDFRLELIRSQLIFEKRIKIPQGYSSMRLDVRRDRRSIQDIERIKVFNAKADSCRRGLLKNTLDQDRINYDDVCPESIPNPPRVKEQLTLYFEDRSVFWDE